LKIPFIDLQTQYKAHQQSIDAAVSGVLAHGQYIMGPEVKELEAALAEYIGVKHVLACSSGTDALVLPMMAKQLSRKDAIFTSPFTFFASAEAITLSGATPVFVDIDPKTYNLDAGDLKKKIRQVIDETDLTPKGIVPVDLFGIAANYQEILAVAQQFDLFVLEDAAQSFGAPYHGQKAGAMGDVAATSFYPAKPLGCYGDGGAVFTNDDELYESLISLRVHGQAQSGNKYDNVRIGLNARMDTIQAAVLLEKLKFYDEEIRLRNEVASYYMDKLSENVTLPHVPDNQGSVWAQFSIQVPDREKLKTDMAANDIPTAVFYPIPIHLSTAYQHLGYSEGAFPVSEQVAKHIISLPMHPYLDTKDIDRICDTVNQSVG